MILDLKRKNGFSLVGILLSLGMMTIGILLLYSFMQKNIDEQNKTLFLDLKPAFASFYKYSENNKSDSTLTGDVLKNVFFAIEYSNEYYGTEIKKDKFVSRHNVSPYLNYKYVLPEQLASNEEFKKNFKDIFTKTQNEFNKNSFDDVDFNNVYLLQLELDKLLMESIENVSSMNRLTPGTRPKYEFVLKDIA